MIADERVERLGKYFVAFKVREKYGFTFEEFIRAVDSGRWKEIVA